MKKLVILFGLFILILTFDRGVFAQLVGEVTPAQSNDQTTLRETLLKIFNLYGTNNETQSPASSTPTPTRTNPGVGGQQQGTLNFSVSSTPSPKAQQSGVQQVDWVYGGQGVCWSAWSVGSCTLFSHEGGLTTPSMRDLDHDGSIDVECSEGNGSRLSTSIKNVSDRPITINCERYTCANCTTGNGSHAQCDGGIDNRAIRVFDEVTITAGCTATCTLSGAYGSCLARTTAPDTPDQPDFPNLTPTPTSSLPRPTTNQPTLPTSTPGQTTNNNLNSKINEKITDSNIESIIRNLVDDDATPDFDQKQTRLTGTRGYKNEMNYLLDLFFKAGIQAEIQTATGVDAGYSNLKCPTDVPIYNLVARINGKSTDKYILSAHLDSREENLDPDSPAPGADRNGSGAAAVVSAALSLAGEQPEKTMEFVLFGGTEQGLCGSAFYMQTVKNSNQNILGAINLDMIGNPSADGSQCVNVGYRTNQDRVIAAKIVSSRDELNINLAGSLIATNYDASNHKHFNDNGIPTAIVMECNLNDRYFTQNDTLLDENGNYLMSIPQITKTAKMVAAALVRLSEEGPTVPDQPNNEGIPPPGSPPQTKPSPTPRPVGSLLPVGFHYFHYEDEVNQFPPTFIYGNLNRSYDASKTQREIAGLAAINGNVTKMLLVSEYAALEQILNNHSVAIREAGITWIGLNAERDGRTPGDELNNIFSSDTSSNTLNRYGRLVAQYGLKLMFGPTTPMWNGYFGGRDVARGDTVVAEAMFGDTCALDGIAFQEQNQLGSSGNAEERKNVIAARTKFFRALQASCPDFEVQVQIMPQQCEQNLSWEQCRAFFKSLNLF